ncbi:TRAP transporter small permease [Ruegeria sp. PrR005]|uniref:TRAP transporter small permease protein n=1 Tax=Ruegeria sp. PrR005 TaxID=2706882 RepID=A0A6B2NT09_9RHOB|nr:TRAP transporter small permease [Ruegeria sp. PrR005]NDW46558.1 TRAP transporter small permease [Ruegeria sp. PrR005]
MNRLIDRVAMVMGILGGVVLFGLVFLTFSDVILRYFFSAPLRGRQDIVEIGMVVTLMLAAPYAWRTASHISVDLYDGIPFRPLEVLRRLLVKLSVAAVSGLIAWRSLEAAEDAALFNEATNMIGIPHLPFIRLITAITVLHLVILIAETWDDVKEATTGGQAGGYES